MITKEKIKLKLLFVVALVLMLASCNRPVVILDEIPKNTPPGSKIFIAGDFNRWDPGDPNFVMEMREDSSYFVKLPYGWGTLDYKFTRGDWSTVETDLCGSEIENRTLDYLDDHEVHVKVDSWKDLEAINCPEVTLVINTLPKETPKDDPIAIAGDFNEWVIDSSSRLKKDPSTGKYIFKIPRLQQKQMTEFLVTRGNLFKAEADKYGNVLEKRQVRFGAKDTVYIDVESWGDLTPKEKDNLTVILDQIPEEFIGDQIYITGTFNGWFPRDNEYRFIKNAEGKYEVNIPREEDNIQFKITRGDWSTEEVDRFGYKKDNYHFEFGKQDTLRLKIYGWLDRSNTSRPYYTFVLDSVPTGTPDNAEIYMAASKNGWNPSSFKFRFKKHTDGKYYLTLFDAWRSFEYKLTMGSWNKQEVDETGKYISNRVFKYNDQDTVYVRVKNWLHLPRFDQGSVVILLEDIPPYTPSDADIYIAGTFNRWDPGNADYILNRTGDGHYYIKIPRSRGVDEIQFKFTLGSWDFEELDARRRGIENRTYRYGFADTLKLKVDNWKGVRR